MDQKEIKRLYPKVHRKHMLWKSKNTDGGIFDFIKDNGYRVATFFPYGNTEDWSFRIKYPFGIRSTKNYVAGSRGEDVSYPTHDDADEVALDVVFQMMEEGL
jgi:hypothetical protein